MVISSGSISIADGGPSAAPEPSGYVTTTRCAPSSRARSASASNSPIVGTPSSGSRHGSAAVASTTRPPTTETSKTPIRLRSPHMDSRVYR